MVGEYLCLMQPCESKTKKITHVGSDILRQIYARLTPNGDAFPTKPNCVAELQGLFSVNLALFAAVST
jgi:hypothetical protein